MNAFGHNLRRVYRHHSLKPRIFFVEPQEDIDDLTEKLLAVKADSIALVVPYGAILLQSIISLKILRNNAEKAGKNIMLVTRDSNGREFAEQLGIPAYSDLEQLETPIIAKKLRQLQKNSSHKPLGKRKLIEPVVEEKAKPTIDFEQKKIELLELLSRPSKPLLFSISVVSLLLLLLVTTVVLPGATVKINPQKKVLEATLNVILATDVTQNDTDSWRQQIVKAVPIDSIFERTIPFETVTKNFTGQNASGELTLVNELNEELALRPGTRFQNSEGIVLRSEDWIRLPALAERTVPIIADERDAFGEFSGARGNVEAGTKFFLPGLDPASQESVYAEVRSPMSGGVSGFVPLVSEKDLEIAKAQITEMIKRDARADAEAFVKRKNMLEESDYILVPGDEFLDLEILEITFPENIVGKNVPNFSVRSRVRVRLIAFSQSEMLSVLEGALLKSVDPGMELVLVESNGISPEVLEISPKKTRIKITVTARGLEAFVIEPRTVEGIQFVNRVKRAVVGKSVPEAKKILENFEEVSEVQISLWPPLVWKIPSLPENISVRLFE